MSDAADDMTKEGFRALFQSIKRHGGYRNWLGEACSDMQPADTVQVKKADLADLWDSWHRGCNLAVKGAYDRIEALLAQEQSE
jgi:hypothetical protein